MRTKSLVPGFVLAVAVILVTSQLVVADVKMPAVFNSRMVLQRQLDNPVWGWADPGEEVSVEIAGQTKKAVADAKGKWFVRLDELEVGGPYQMTVTGKNQITFDDILVGDVWICSGQSNMGWAVSQSKDAPKEIAEGNFPHIRLLTVYPTSKAVPQDDVQLAPWTVCSPAVVGNFSGVGYFFGRKIHEELGIPIGLISNPWGGAACEAYVDPVRLAEFPELLPTLDAKRVAEAIDQQKAGYLYNGMVLPICPYGIKGVIWYQGESNVGRATQHDLMFPVMIQNWREIWGQGDFPFLFVQLANFLATQDTPGESDWAELRESQDRALALRETGQAVIIDIGDTDDIHPANKQDVGLRLAALALAGTYGQDTIPCGPRFKTMKITGNEVTLSFDHVGSGLETRPVDSDSSTPTGFAVAGADRKFYWANAKIVDDQVIVSSPNVPLPVAVRYAWANNPICNLYNKEGFPTAPFRTDLWPRITHKQR